MKKRRRARKKKRFRPLIWGIVVIAGVLLLNCSFMAGRGNKNNDDAREDGLSSAVAEYRPVVAQYAAEYGIEEYTDYLLAVMQVESGGNHEDVMQSSESLGLPPNSLETEESINQGCRYFAKLLRLAAEKGCDFNTVVQAYNFGDEFLDFVAENGGTYTVELAEEYARQKSGGEEVTYLNPIALKANGGWRYKYGNMFYVQLVYQYV